MELSNLIVYESHIKSYIIGNFANPVVPVQIHLKTFVVHFSGVLVGYDTRTMFQRRGQRYQNAFCVLVVYVKRAAQTVIEKGKVKTYIRHIGLFPCQIGICQNSLGQTSCDISIQDIICSRK